MPKSRKQKPPFRMKRVPEDLALLVDRYLERVSPKPTYEAALAHLLKRGLLAEGIGPETDKSVAA